MSIEIRFITVVVVKEAVESSFDGGLAAFCHCYPEPIDDGDLIASVFMSGGEALDCHRMLEEGGVNVEQDVVVVDMMTGPYTETVERIEVVNCSKKRLYPNYVAAYREPTTSKQGVQ